MALVVWRGMPFREKSWLYIEKSWLNNGEQQLFEVEQGVCVWEGASEQAGKRRWGMDPVIPQMQGSKIR